MVWSTSGTVSPRKQPTEELTQFAAYASSATLEAARLLESQLAGAEGDVHRPVEHEPPDAVREQLGVRRAELGAVGEPEIVQRTVAQRRPQDVHVTGGLGGRDVGGQRTREAAAAGRHPRAARPGTSASSRAVVGSGSSERYWSSWESLRQSTGELSPVPRGSNPTTSKCSSSGWPRTCDPAAANVVPGSPGPPGLITSEPSRDPGSAAGTLSRDSPIVRPDGWR